ncbi:MAG: sugar phosphate nucleotidyltransferase [Bacteroidales bacterium]
MKALIFTAGLENSSMPRNAASPKALIEINGEPLLGMLIKRLAGYGFREIIINVHHFADRIINFLNVNGNFGVKVVISDETDLHLDTGGGLSRVARFFNDGRPCLVYNLEILTDIDLAALYEDHIKSTALVTIVVRKRRSTRFMLFDNKLQLCGWENIETGEVRNARPCCGDLYRYAFSRVQVIDPGIFKLITEKGTFSLAELYLRLAELYTIKGYPDNESIWMDLGKREGMIEAEKLFFKN